MRPPVPPTLRLPQTGRSFRRPVALSAAAHLAAIFLLIWVAGRSAGSPAAPGGSGPLGGGERVDFLTLPAYRVPAPPDQTLNLKPRRQQPAVQVRVQDVSTTTSVADVVPSGLLAGGLRGVAGAAVGRVGAGSGTGPGSGSGTGAEGGIFPPQARYSILPPLPKPASVRGMTFRVRFWVDAAGRVTKVDVSPQIPDGEYRKKFVALMYEYAFTPATRPDGTPVAGETVLTITL